MYACARSGYVWAYGLSQWPGSPFLVATSSSLSLSVCEYPVYLYCVGCECWSVLGTVQQYSRLRVPQGAARVNLPAIS